MASALTQREKLRALGLSLPSEQNNPYLSVFDAIRAAKDYSTFTSDVGGQASYSEFETYLTDTIGVASSDATSFRKRMEQKYDDFSDFQTTIDGFSSYDEWINSFSWGTTIAGDETDGENITGGIRIHGEAGVSYDGVNVQAGTVEVFGPRIEFSETGTAVDASTSFSTANLAVSDSTPNTGSTIDITADVTNNSGFEAEHTAKLIEDGEVTKTTTVTIGDGNTKQVSFTQRYDEPTSVDIQINDTSTTTVTWIPPGL